MAGKTYAILGSGMQGVAAAYYIAKHAKPTKIWMADRDSSIAEKAAARLNKLLPGNLFSAKQINAKDEAQVRDFLKEVDAVMSAMDYSLNVLMTERAIETKTALVDLGGNTQVVLDQLKLNEAAKNAGVHIVPDCGLAPGLGNTLAAFGIEQMDEVENVKVRCGGLSQSPRPPLGYKLVFSVRGLTNEYFGKAWILRDGKRVSVDTFSELENLSFPSPIGDCEAFVTSGGSSTCPWSFEGKVKNYDYKTVRYPGHYDKMKLFLDMGFLEEEPLQVGEVKVAPREVFHELAQQKLQFPEDKDLVVLRAEIIGKKNGKDLSLKYELIDFHDDKTGFTAMERTTGFPAAQVLIDCAEGRTPAGVHTLETALKNKDYLAALSKELQISGL